VVATGGGAFALEENRRLMKSAGVVVWLDVPLDEILGRIEGEERPLWKTLEEIRALHERRQRAYAQAHHRLPLGGAERTEALEKLHRLLVGCGKVS
jgi:shikimate kinase